MCHSSLHAGYFSCFYCRLLSFFKINFFQKFFQKNYQSNVLDSDQSVLIWVQTVCKGYRLIKKKLPLARKELSMSYILKISLASMYFSRWEKKYFFYLFNFNENCMDWKLFWHEIVWDKKKVVVFYKQSGHRLTSTVNVLKFRTLFSFCSQVWISQNACRNSKQRRPWSGSVLFEIISLCFVLLEDYLFRPFSSIFHKYVLG